MLDYFLGEELGVSYNNAELKELINIHISNEHAELGVEVGNIMSGALEMNKVETARNRITFLRRRKPNTKILHFQTQIFLIVISEVCTNGQIKGLHSSDLAYFVFKV